MVAWVAGWGGGWAGRGVRSARQTLAFGTGSGFKCALVQLAKVCCVGRESSFNY
jgi:hypothetical protein